MDMGFWGFVGSAAVILLLSLLILYEIFMRKPMQLTMEESSSEAAPAVVATSSDGMELPPHPDPVMTEEEANLILQATREAEAREAPEPPAAGQPEAEQSRSTTPGGIFAQFTWMTCASEPEPEGTQAR